jgi:prepilin-type processing-associated H-X9-DG protein
MKYLSKNSSAIFICPSDDGSGRAAGDYTSSNGAYIYSYAMNNKMSSFDQPANPVLIGRPAGKMSKVRNPAEKVLMYEEDERTLDDGGARPDAATAKVNMLAIRHDRTRKFPDDYVNGQPIPNIDRNGNAVFCDGHAAPITRLMLHDPRNRWTDPFFK